MELAKKQIKGIFISQIDGTFLVSAKFDETLNEKLLSAFIGALQMFGKESVGKIDEIIIKGLDLEVLIVDKHGLLLTAIYGRDMHKENLRKQAEIALDSFYARYAEQICNDSSCLSNFEEYESILKEQISNYFNDDSKDKDGYEFWDIILQRIGKD